MTYRIYGFETCPYCQKAKALLDEEGIPYEFVAIATQEERAAFLDARGFTAPNRTFPRVYRVKLSGDQLVGGYSDLEDEIMLELTA